MELKKYIESGILEQYVLGLLSREDRKTVEENLKKYPELREELLHIEHGLESYISLYKRPAPVGMEAKILENINKTKTDPTTGSARKGIKFLPLLFGSLFIGALLLSSILYYQGNQKSAKIANLESELTQLKSDCDEKEGSIQNLQQQLQIIRDANNSFIQMKGTPKAPQAIASIYYNEQTRKAYLDIINLPAPPSDKQYQLWAIVDGTPVDMGVFEVVLDATSFQEVPFVENPQAFAVTLEARGGSPVPTLEEMVVIGNV